MNQVNPESRNGDQFRQKSMSYSIKKGTKNHSNTASYQQLPQGSNAKNKVS